MPDKFEIFRSSSCYIHVHKGYFRETSKSVEAHLLFAILEKLEEIRCGLIDVEPKGGGSLTKIKEEAKP